MLIVVQFFKLFRLKIIMIPIIHQANLNKYKNILNAFHNFAFFKIEGLLQHFYIY